MSNKTKILIAMAIITLAAASRLVKHPFNFTPIAAMALFAGCYLRRWWGIFLPLGAMLASDILLYVYKYGWAMFDWKTTLAVYVGIGLAFLVGWYLRRHLKWYGVFGAAVASSVIFFLITNFAVWAFFDWYPHTWAGLVSCFTLAIPFFRNTFFGDLVYSAGFFGLYELSLYFSRRTEKSFETGLLK